MTPPQPVIIIRKKRAHRHAHHGGAWKVAFADFATAMMAFFLVMWIIAQGDQTKAGIAEYFRDPGVFEKGRGAGALDAGPALNEAVAPPTPSEVEQAQAVLEEAATKLRHTLEGLPEFANLRNRVEIEVTPEGLRIELLEGAIDGFFEVGRSVLKEGSVRLLGVIATDLGKLPNHIAIEGHTDSRPYVSGDHYVNWELSTDRANVARRVMQTQGLGAAQIEAVRGYADTRLRFADNPLDARNRRISIVVRNPTASPR